MSGEIDVMLNLLQQLEDRLREKICCTIPPVKTNYLNQVVWVPNPASFEFPEGALCIDYTCDWCDQIKRRIQSKTGMKVVGPAIGGK